MIEKRIGIHDDLLILGIIVLTTLRTQKDDGDMIGRLRLTIYGTLPVPRTPKLPAKRSTKYLLLSTLEIYLIEAAKTDDSSCTLIRFDNYNDQVRGLKGNRG